jgi:hypothetical protein
MEKIMRTRLCELKLEVAVGCNERLVAVRRLKDTKLVCCEGVITAPTKSEVQAATKAFLAVEAAMPEAV